MAESFSDFVARERERLHAEREAIFNQQHELEQKLAAINNEMRAIDAYESTKAGKPIPATRQVRSGRQTSGVRRGSKREELLRVIRENPAGLKRREILEQMGLKGNKAGEMSVSNALTALTKNGQVARNDGKYQSVP